MFRPTYAAVGLAALIGAAIACSDRSTAPTTPSGATPPTTSAAAADGSTLKATAPVPQSPINGVQAPQGPITLVVTNSTMKFGGGLSLSYRFEVTNAASAVVDTGVAAEGAGTTSRIVGAALDGTQTYQWRARAEYQGSVGPWSARQSFIAPLNEGYLRGNELYDPLTNGKTIGEISGATQFIPGVGIQLSGVGTFVTYHFPGTLTEGEFSAIFTNVTTTSEEILRRLISMRQGTFEINDNPYRMTVGVDSNGEFDWRFITGDPFNFIKTEGDAQRPRYPFKANLTYFVQATWRDSFFHVVFKEGGVNGTTIYDFGKTYQGVYKPNPQNVYLGSPYAPGDRGERVTCALAIIRQVWVSANPRPSFANQ